MMQPDVPNKPNIIFFLFLFLTPLGENGRRSLSVRPGLHFSPQPVENVPAPMHLPTIKTTLKLGRSETDLYGALLTYDEAPAPLTSEVTVTEASNHYSRNGQRTPLDVTLR